MPHRDVVDAANALCAEARAKATACHLCEVGFPRDGAGRHYGTQSLGMIATTPCADASRTVLSHGAITAGRCVRRQSVGWLVSIRDELLRTAISAVRNRDDLRIIEAEIGRRRAPIKSPAPQPCCPTGARTGALLPELCAECQFEARNRALPPGEQVD